MDNRGQGWSQEFGYPRFVVWIPRIVCIVFLGIGIEALTDVRNQSGSLLAFWMFWNFGCVVGLISYSRSFNEIRFRARVSDEGIERLQPLPSLKVRWNEIHSAETTAQSLTLSAAAGEIAIPRTLPEYTELYQVIAERVSSSVLHPTSGLPLLVHYGSLNLLSFLYSSLNFAGWFVLAYYMYRSGTLTPLWYGIFVAFPLLGGIQDWYRRSKRYEFGADRIVARTAFGTKEYLKSDLKDGYLDEVQGNHTMVPILRLVFQNGNELEVRSGSITVEELYRVLKAHYSLV